MDEATNIQPGFIFFGKKMLLVAKKLDIQLTLKLLLDQITR